LGFAVKAATNGAGVSKFFRGTGSVFVGTLLAKKQNSEKLMLQGTERSSRSAQAKENPWLPVC
jgi:hypothetical protein